MSGIYVQKNPKVKQNIYMTNLYLFQAFGNLSYCQEYCLQHYVNFWKISIISIITIITKVFTNYDSFIFDTYNIGLAHTLLFRFFKICSSMGNFHIEVEQTRSIFKCNNYLVNIIDQCIKKFLDKLYFPKQIVPTVPKREFYN